MGNITAEPFVQEHIVSYFSMLDRENELASYPSFHWAMILALQVLSTEGDFQNSDSNFLLPFLMLISSFHFATRKPS